MKALSLKALSLKALSLKALSLKALQTVAWAAVPMLLLWNNAAYACAVCGTSKEEARVAFILMTAFLTLLPLSMLGGLIVWITKKSRALDAAEAAQADLEARLG